MPEGHTIHREARLQTKHFAGTPLDVTSPQGRFSAGAKRLDGNQIKGIEALGKHLFYRWDHGPILHVHLGLFGGFRRHLSNPPPPTDGTRLAMRGDGGVLYLSGPTICELVDEEEHRLIASRIGPDPLTNIGDEAAVSHISEFMSRRTSPVAAALLDQSVIAGIGNVYRSEILFLTGIHPLIPSSQLEEEQIGALWSEARRQLEIGERSGRIVTTEPSDVGAERRSDIGRGERTYVYKRHGQPCRRCGTAIQRDVVANRKVWMCPNCQPT